MKKRTFTGIIIAFFIADGLIYFYFPGEKPHKKTASPEKLTPGVEMSILPAALRVAEKKNYFQQEGLHVTIKEFASGKNALATMLNEGGLHMVTVARTSVMFNSFKRNDYTIIASMVYSGIF
ncbi:MAG: ABC transporter substrate-binding protein [Deltaproteobacteria bacterium]|nr:ABC transporter substrate-binding protein [Deltaproteobacteria bacterium]